MTVIKKIFYVILMINGIYSEVSIDEQLEHIMKRHRESQGERDDIISGLSARRQEGADLRNLISLLGQRRYAFNFDQSDSAGIIGAPSLPSHLPEAEAILPGHTLIRPALGMLKSSIKFPHRDLENGAGVLGNYNNLGIKYDGRNERIMYTGFRRNAPSQSARRYSTSDHFENTRRTPYDYILVAPSTTNSEPIVEITNLVLDLEKKKQANKRLLKLLKLIKKPLKDRLTVYVADPRRVPQYLRDLYKEKDTVVIA